PGPRALDPAISAPAPPPEDGGGAGDPRPLPSAPAPPSSDPSVEGEKQEVQAADPDDDPPPLRKRLRRCSRCGIPGHRADGCDVQPMGREERLLAIEAWATRRRALALPPVPAAKPPPEPKPV